MDKKNVPVMFEKLQLFEAEDKRFIKVKIWLLHLGKIFNGSFFTKESVLKALPTITNTPILATLEDGDFEEHNTTMILDETTGEYKDYSTASAIGVIPETCNPQFEMRTTDSGEEREFLTVEALVWSKLSDFSDLLVSKEVANQSMEVTDIDGFMREDGYFEFTDFKFYGACLLGDKYAPAMENSTVEVNFSSKVNMNIIEENLKQFNKLFSQEGGNAMTVPKKEEVLEEVKANTEFAEETEAKEEEKAPEAEVTEVEETDTQDEAKPEEAEAEEGKEESQEGAPEEETPEVEPTEEEPKGEFARIVSNNFAIANGEIKRLIREELAKITYNNYDYENSKYYLLDFTADHIIAEDNSDRYVLKAIPYTINGSEVTILEESAQKVHMEYIIFNAEAPEFVFVNSEERAKMEADLKELEELRAFKRETEEAELASMFNTQLPEAELAEVFAQSKDNSLEEVQKELFALVGKKNFSISQTASKAKAEPIQLQVNDKQVDEKLKNEPYGGLFAKYLKQNN